MVRLALLLSLSPLALAFSNTSPFVAWSSHSSSAIDRLPLNAANIRHSTHLIESILSDDDICGHDAIIIVDQPGLHASDLRSFSKNSHLSRSLSSASSSRQFAYIPTAPQHDSELSSLAQSVSEKCSSRLVSFMPGQGGVEFEKGEKAVLVISMPSLELHGSHRKNTMLDHDALLSNTLTSLPYANHLVVYTGSPLALSKRQSPDIPDRPVFDFTSPSATSAAKNKGGILHNYQLLTPGLITVLLVVLFVFLPILYFGVSALASIQSPIRLEVTPKGYNAGDKKNQ